MAETRMCVSILEGRRGTILLRTVRVQSVELVVLVNKHSYHPPNFIPYSL